MTSCPSRPWRPAPTSTLSEIGSRPLLGELELARVGAGHYVRRVGEQAGDELSHEHRGIDPQYDLQDAALARRELGADLAAVLHAAQCATRWPTGRPCARDPLPLE